MITLDDQSSFHKELDLIQAVITRMSSNSFSVKGWTYAITGGVLGLTKDVFFKTNMAAEVVLLSLLLLLIVTALWYLDAYFLKTEKQYRELYEWMVKMRTAGILDHKYCLYPAAIPELNEKIQSTPLLNSETAVMQTKALQALYMPLAFFVVALAFIHFIMMNGCLH